MLCKVPVKYSVTFDANPQPELKDGSDKKDMGITSQPKGTVPPRLNLVVAQKQNEWKVTCLVIAATEGTNYAGYLAPGSYPSGLAIHQHGSLGPNDEQHPEILFVVDTVSSDLSMRAEIEHCNDWIQAHKITSTAVEDVIRFAKPGLENRVFQNRSDCYKGALEAFVGHSKHDKIAAVFRKSITSGDFDPQKFKKAIEDLFLAIGEKTSQRDSQGWHTFDLNRTTVSPGSNKHNMLQGPNFHVGATSSVQLITLD
jgi:hypothetical protein